MMDHPIDHEQAHVDHEETHGVEHVPDSTFVIPIIDQRSLLNLKRAVQVVAQRTACWRQIEDPIGKIAADIEYLRELAGLSRYLLLGDALARRTLRVEFELLLQQYRVASEPPKIDVDTSSYEEDRAGAATNFNVTALFDIFLAAFLLYRNDQDKLSELNECILFQFRAATSVPLFYASAARTILDEAPKSATEPARAALVGLARRLGEYGSVMLPLPHSCEEQISRVVHFWERPNLVHAVFDMVERNTIPIQSISSRTLEMHQQVDIELSSDCALESKQLVVVFAPSFYRAKIVHSRGNVVSVEVPPASEVCRILALHEPGADALMTLDRLQQDLQMTIPGIWSTSALGMIPFNRWSYPTLVNSAIDVLVYPPVDSVEVEILCPDGEEVLDRRIVMGQTYQLKIVPRGADKPRTFAYDIDFSHGDTQSNKSRVTSITPREVGRGTILVKLPRTEQAVEVDIIPNVPKLSDLIDTIVRRECKGRSDEDSCRRVGRWDPVIENALEIVGVHAVLLHTGKVLFYAFDHRTVNNTEALKKYFGNPNLGSYQIWDPATGRAGSVKPVGRNVFCAGQCQLPNGHILVAGGQDGAGAVELTEEWGKWLAAGGTATFWIPGLDTNNGSSKDLHTYSPVADTWSRWPDMEENRYYPTCEILPTGNAIVVAGLSNLQRFIASGSNWNQVDYYEIFDMSRLNEGAIRRDQFRSADQYPILRMLPGSDLLFVHVHNTTRLFDIVASQWVPGAEFVPPEPVGRWTYPMQTGHVLLPQYEGEHPRIFIAGGSEESNFDYNTQSNARAVQRGYIFELDVENVQNSRWRETRGRPHAARLLNDLVLLPDGTVFIVNGISGGAASGHNQAPVLACEIFDPATESFTQMEPPDAGHPRGYHATALLLPDGRVAIAGHTKTYNQPVSPDDTSIQVYNPPYLCKGPRPVIIGAEASFDYGEVVRAVNQGPMISKAIIIRPGAVTHSVDMSQRGVWLKVEQTEDRVEVLLPTDRSLALPGYHMLFFLSEDGVPSLAHWIHLGKEYFDWTAEGGCPGDYVHEEPLHLGAVENHRVVEIVRNGDVFIQKVDQHCNVKVTSRCGSIYIEEKIDQHCWVHLSAKHNVLIGEKVDQHCIVHIDCGGDVSFGWRNSGEGKIDQHCQVNVYASHGNLTLTKKVDANSSLYARIDEGHIEIGEKVDGGSVCILFAPNGTIHIGEKVGGGAQVHWRGSSFLCPDTGDGEVAEM